MPDVLVHKAVEPGKLTVRGQEAYDNLRKLNPEHAYLFLKLDGVYCQVLHDGEKWRAYSRTGEELLSVGPKILGFFEAEGDKGRRYIGELWRDGPPHSVINGEARKKSVVDRQELWLFDSYKVKHPAAAGIEPEPYRERLRAVRELNSLDAAYGAPGHHVRWLPHIRLRSYSDLEQAALLERARLVQTRPTALDGLILRDGREFFIPGSGTDGGNYKIKPRPSGDFRVIGTTPGKGRHAGRIGALIVSLGGDHITEVGSGLTDEDRERTDWAGAIVEVEYLSLTRDGKLREPSFKSRRWDKTEADVLPHTQKGTD